MSATDVELPVTMRAAVWRGDGPQMSIETVRMPRPRRGEVLVRVEACGVCHTDLHVLKGEVPFPAPAVLGHEISGTLVELGPGVAGAGRLALGDRVVGSFIMPCGDCAACDTGRDDLCANFYRMNRLGGTLYDGQTRIFAADGSPIHMYSMGGMAEYAVVPVTGVARIGAALPFGNAAVLGCAALTAYGAVRHAADLRIGESAVVIGFGGVGANVLQLARAVGAGNTIVVDISAEKLADAIDRGAGATVNAALEDPVEAVLRLTAGRGADVVFEVLGSARTFAQATGMLADGGRLVAVGIAPAGVLGEVPITQLVRRSQRVIGSYGARTRTDLASLVELVERGVVSPHDMVSRTFGLEDVNLAFAELAAGKVHGRAIVRPTATP